MTTILRTAFGTPLTGAMPQTLAAAQVHPDCGDALMLVFRVHRSLSRALTDDLQHALGVSFSHARAMLCLAGSRPVSCTELARRLDWDGSHISRLVPVLERKNLITSHRCADDRRTVRLSLTSAGAALADRVPAVLRDSEERFLSGIDERERELLRSLLLRVACHGENAVCDRADGASNALDN
ncbi:MarR family winged helix-turn-helix transcriptional regulator [Paraburkholderia sp. EG286B]|uniref:MarR family winged helix-turn-helix transcriptional regulator n=1 Tax=Paraburkholderia sp. EG286B TaxID=3237011 RepID=UPI0034D3331E